MDIQLEIGLYIFILAGFLGFHIISRVPPLLHTPLMSATNAMSGISLVGSIVVCGADYSPNHDGSITLSTVFGFIAVACSSTNVVGGFLITDRMLKMFKTGEQAAAGDRKGFPVGMAAALAAVVALVAGAVVLAKMREPGGFDPGRYLSSFYILSAVLFILGIKGLTSPRWARRGMYLAELGMVLAVVGTFFDPAIHSFLWILLGLVIGTVIGGSLGLWVPMTAVPQRTAFSHALGALAATLIGIAEFAHRTHVGAVDGIFSTAVGFEVLIGGLTFTGSLMAAGKLAELLPGAPITYKFQNASNILLLAATIGCLVYTIIDPYAGWPFYVMVGLALLFGFLLVIPIGAADMPVVISLLNSYAGLADAAMGFVLMNKIQIITGSLDGTSGFLLSILMCRAMNRSAMNVLFGAFGKVSAEPELPGGAASAEGKGTVRSITPDETTVLFDNARSVIIVPGYGLAVAQAQHACAELASSLGKRGIDVKYAIHPVAGRMPGHMNVLLAEANVPYDKLHEMEEINPYFGEADIVLVVGANDVTNPAARTNKASPLYGMPILEVDRAKSIIVLKRSMRPGFAGVDNELYFNPKCVMLFGDAKESLTKLVGALKG